MTRAVLTVNAGSSSIKFALFAVSGPEPGARFLQGNISGIGATPAMRLEDEQGRPMQDERPGPLRPGMDHHAALGVLLDVLAHHSDLPLAAAGHRIVHGGDRHTGPELLDEALLAELDTLVPLAPLHQPHNLEAVRALAKLRPDLPQVGCFDTAFHQTQPMVARTFALPRALTQAGVRRYGFHGLSYEYIASALPRVTGSMPTRTVVAHLGNGASMCAMHDGASVATTMGFTALDGLMMGTRCGAIDPGVLLYLMETRGMDSAALTDLLYHQSGLLGASGISSDMRALLASPAPEAAAAVDLFCYRVAEALGGLCAALQGLDALVFTAGIGEHAAPVRAAICARARWLGVEIDPDRNASGAPRIDTGCGPVSVWVIPTDEESIIARHAMEVVREAR